jgi:hypothetical protein
LKSLPASDKFSCDVDDVKQYSSTILQYGHNTRSWSEHAGCQGLRPIRYEDNPSVRLVQQVRERQALASEYNSDDESNATPGSGTLSDACTEEEFAVNDAADSSGSQHGSFVSADNTASVSSSTENTRGSKRRADDAIGGSDTRPSKIQVQERQQHNHGGTKLFTMIQCVDEKCSGSNRNISSFL